MVWEGPPSFKTQAGGRYQARWPWGFQVRGGPCWWRHWFVRAAQSGLGESLFLDTVLLVGRVRPLVGPSSIRILAAMEMQGWPVCLHKAMRQILRYPYPLLDHYVIRVSSRCFLSIFLAPMLSLSSCSFFYFPPTYIISCHPILRSCPSFQ